MPTARPRHTITETDEIQRALDDAAERWPRERQVRSKLLIQLIELGHRALLAERAEAIARRRQAIAATSGQFDDLYEDGYLENLREDWPE